MSYVNCKLCPRQCGVDRTRGQTGFCRCPDTALVAKAMLHKWEEPVLAGRGGSGAIFFGGCNLGCKYCQNAAISGGPVGTPTDSAGLRRLMEELIAQGAENIDLVTPTQFLPTVIPALKPRLPVPVVYNCGGYEQPDAVAALEGLVDICQMVRQTGPVQWQADKLTRGVIIRHLILPGHIENSLKVLDWIGETFAPGEVLVSLMRQYTPMGGLPAPFDRPISSEEFDAVLSWMYLNELQGFTQEEGAADTAFIPDF